MEVAKDIPVLGIIKFKTDRQLSVHEILECQRKYESSYVKDFRHGRKWFLIMKKNTFVSRDNRISAENSLHVRTRNQHYILKEYHIDRQINEIQRMSLERQFNGEFVREYKINSIWVVIMRHEIENPAPPPSLSPSQRLATDDSQIMDNDTFVNSLMNSPYKV